MTEHELTNIYIIKYTLLVVFVK